MAHRINVVVAGVLLCLAAESAMAEALAQSRQASLPDADVQAQGMAPPRKAVSATDVNAESQSSQAESIKQEARRKECIPNDKRKGDLMFLGKQLRARVVDGNTKTPLEGVVVFALWGTRTIDGEDIMANGVVHVAEALTDKDGFFTIPAWGPLPIVRQYVLNIPWYAINPDRFIHANPYLVLYKEGYLTRRGERAESPLGDPVLRPGVPGASAYDGKDISFYGSFKPDPDADMYSRFLVADAIHWPLRELSFAEPCAWQRLPLTIAAAWPWVRDKLKDNPDGTFILWPLLSCDEVRVAAGCRSLKDYLETVK